jgi:hypothetical protein
MAIEQQNNEQTPQATGASVPTTVASSAQYPVPSSGRRQAFDDVMTPLTPQDLASAGTQKLVLYMLQQSQNQVIELSGYSERFHESDKRAAVLQEKLDAQSKFSKSVEIAVITGTTLGGALIGVATYFWAKTPPDNTSGWLALVIGALLVIGAAIVKVSSK